MTVTHNTSRPCTPDTAIHQPRTPHAPKKPKAKILEYLKPTVYKPEADELPETSKATLNALSRASVRKPCVPKVKNPKVQHSAPRKLTVSIVDGDTERVIHKYVPTRLLMAASTTAANVLDPRPWAGRFKVYGMYDVDAMNSVLCSIILSQKMNVNAEDLRMNLLTYEACKRLGVPSNHNTVKPLVAAINKQLSSAEVSNELVTFISCRLGCKDVVFTHMAHVLCNQRFKGEVQDGKAFEKMVARRPTLQKAMVQIDRAHKARREAFNASKRGANKGDDLNVEEVVEATVKGKVGVSEEQQNALLALLKSEDVAGEAESGESGHEKLETAESKQVN